MKIAMVASEANPFVKSGGLADVVYALSKELVTFGHEVAILLPYYKSAEARLVKKPMFKGALHFNMSWRDCYAEVYELVQDGITYYFIKNEQYFGRDGLYGYGDDGERFAFFTLAARNALPLVNFQPDIIHVHDWQSGMLPALIKVQNHNDPFYQKTRFVMTIHNPAFKGMLDPSALDNLYNLPYSIYEDGSTRFEGRVSTLKSGIVYADKGFCRVKWKPLESPVEDDDRYFALPLIKLPGQEEFCGITELSPEDRAALSFRSSGRSDFNDEKKHREHFERAMEIFRARADKCRLYAGYEVPYTDGDGEDLEAYPYLMLSPDGSGQVVNRDIPELGLRVGDRTRQPAERVYTWKIVQGEDEYYADELYLIEAMLDKEE